jgi:hypothetical protein
MSTKPFKRAGFAQPVFVQSATKKEEVGTLRILKDGRGYRYAKAGGSALAAGKLALSAAVAADVMNEACANAHAIGDIQFAETITSATYAADYFAGGYLQINDATGEGHQYKIDSSTAVAAATAITLSLAETIRVALVAATSEFTLVHSPWMAVVESATLGNPAGITPHVVTAAYYYWIQTKGLALALSGNSDAVGKPVFQGTTTAGSVNGADTASYYPQVGIVMGTAGVSGEYKPIMLNID